MYKSEDVANYTINWCHENGIAITNLKLQKLLYFLQGNYYRYTGERLISEDFYAWKLGPVVPKTYVAYSIYSSGKLPKEVDKNTLSNGAKNRISKILSEYASIPTWDLVNLSHQEDPWKYTHAVFGDKSKIPFETIKEYYGRAEGEYGTE